MRLVVLCARLDERDAVLAGLGATSPARLPAYPHTRVAHPGAGTVVVLPAGVGPAAAVAAGIAADRLRPDALLCTGLARGVAPDLGAGAVAVADRVVGADLGADIGASADTEEKASQLRSLDQLGLGTSAYEVTSPLLHTISARVATSELPIRVGEVLSAGALPGSTAAAALLLQRHPKALAVAREGFGVAAAAATFRVPMFEVRVVSELPGTVREGERDDAGLDALASAASALFARDWLAPISTKG